MTQATSGGPSSRDSVAALGNVDAYAGVTELGVTDSGVVMHETHVSWVFLVGEFAFKIKKPIKTSFLDYGTLALREHYCHEEVRLDRRYAKPLYLGVVAITLDGGRVRMEGKGRPIEFAVKMRRFPEDALLSDRLTRGKLPTAEVLQLAIAVASFHRDAARSGPQQPWGSPELVLRTARDNLSELRSAAIDGDVVEIVTALDRWTREDFAANHAVFAQRPSGGFIRECHGDLHLANVIHWQGRLMPFDGIEFNDEFRWIDVMSDAAFLGMDFAVRGHLDLSRSFINAYLEQTGDHGSVSLLRWYLVYRAMVRAKVASIRGEQSGQSEADRSAAARGLPPPHRAGSQLVASGRAHVVDHARLQRKREDAWKRARRATPRGDSDSIRYRAETTLRPVTQGETPGQLAREDLLKAGQSRHVRSAATAGTGYPARRLLGGRGRDLPASTAT